MPKLIPRVISVPDPEGEKGPTAAPEAAPKFNLYF